MTAAPDPQTPPPPVGQEVAARVAALDDAVAAIREALADPECPAHVKSGLVLGRLLLEVRADNARAALGAGEGSEAAGLAWWELAGAWDAGAQAATDWIKSGAWLATMPENPHHALAARAGGGEGSGGEAG